MNYVFVVNDKGIRQTSYVIGIHANTYDEIEDMAKKVYPDCTLLQGDSDMQAKFTEGKAYVNGKFVDAPIVVQEPTRAERIAEIRKYYDDRFAKLDGTLVRRRLSNSSIEDLQEQYATLKTEMMNKIKEVK